MVNVKGQRGRDENIIRGQIPCPTKQAEATTSNQLWISLAEQNPLWTWR